jgi:hypothetical protein
MFRRWHGLLDFGYPYRIVGFFSHKYFILFAFPDLNGTEPRFHLFRYPRFYYDDIWLIFCWTRFIHYKCCMIIWILHLGQGSFTRKVRTIFTLKIIVSIFVKLFLILVLHLRQFFIVRIFVKRATGLFLYSLCTQPCCYHIQCVFSCFSYYHTTFIMNKSCSTKYQSYIIIIKTWISK